MRFRSKAGMFLVSVVLILISILRISTLSIGSAAIIHQPQQSGYYDYEGAIHFHTNYTGDATGSYEEIAGIANRQHVDFMIATEHNNLLALYEHKEGWYGKALFLSGSEITRPEGYLLGLNLRRFPIARSASTDKVLSEIAAQGGMAIIAHPESPRWRWKMKYDPRIIGQEILDLTDQLNTASPLAISAGALFYFINRAAAFMQLYHYPAETIRKWDSETRRHNFVGIFAPDFHQELRLFGYPLFALPRAEDMLPNAHDHIVTAAPFTHDFRHDKSLLYDAIGKGHLYVSIDLLQDASGFFFSARQGGKVAWMGDQLHAETKTDFLVTLPSTVALNNVSIHVLHNGVEIGRSTSPAYRFQADQAGAYRVEVEAEIPTFWGWGRSVTWIYSNPIYLR